MSVLEEAQIAGSVTFSRNQRDAICGQVQSMLEYEETSACRPGDDHAVDRSVVLRTIRFLTTLVRVLDVLGWDACNSSENQGDQEAYVIGVDEDLAWLMRLVGSEIHETRRIRRGAQCGEYVWDGRLPRSHRLALSAAVMGEAAERANMAHAVDNPLPAQFSAEPGEWVRAEQARTTRREDDALDAIRLIDRMTR
jgi:hypothetical protein